MTTLEQIYGPQPKQEKPKVELKVVEKKTEPKPVAKKKGK
jgi:hypothetical protein